MRNPPRMSHLSELHVEYNGHHGRFDVKVVGCDPRNGAEIKWEDHALFLQGVEEIIKSIRINSSL